jgi:homoaconitate hydratase
MSIANMTTEWGALVGWFPADSATLGYLETRREALAKRGIERLSADGLARLEREPIGPDPDATYAGRIELDLGAVTPHVAGPDTVQVATPLAEIEARKIPIQKAYLVSCVNSRLSDIEAAAAVVDGRKTADSVELYIASASKEVEEAAQASGAWQALIDAGAKALPPGCGPCIGLGAGLLEPGEVGISATNRNFKGRMGSREAECYLASPEVVVASALAGFITGPRKTKARRLEPRFQETPAKEVAAEAVEILPGFPEKIVGRLALLPQDNLNTDGIYGKDYTYRDDVTRELMANVVMENYDPEFAERTQAGDVVVGGFNFGTGSSREQAVTALQAKGIPLRVAGSFSQTYLRNAFNNGFLCIAAPALVQRLHETHGERVAAGEKTILPGDEIEVDLKSSRISYRGETFAFPALGPVPQTLVVKGGVENIVKERLGLA